MLKLVHHTHMALKTKSTPVEEFNNKLLFIIEKMLDIMKSEKGIGLAANQIGIPIRLFIMNVSTPEPYIFINPIISPINQEKLPYNEGCLSFPGIQYEKERYQKINVKWVDPNGNFLEKDFEGLEAICIQHENDHINGITFIDDLTPLKRKFLLKKVEKTKLKI